MVLSVELPVVIIVEPHCVLFVGIPPLTPTFPCHVTTRDDGKLKIAKAFWYTKKLQKKITIEKMIFDVLVIVNYYTTSVS